MTERSEDTPLTVHLDPAEYEISTGEAILSDGSTVKAVGVKMDGTIGGEARMPARAVIMLSNDQARGMAMSLIVAAHKSEHSE